MLSVIARLVARRPPSPMSLGSLRCVLVTSPHHVLVPRETRRQSSAPSRATTSEAR